MMPNSGADPQGPIGPRPPLSGGAQAALGRAARLATEVHAAEVTPPLLVAALLQDRAVAAHGGPAAPVRMGSAIAAVIRAAAAAAGRAGAAEIGVDELLVAALGSGASDDVAHGAIEHRNGWPDDDSGAVEEALLVLSRPRAALVVLVAEPGLLPGRLLEQLDRRLQSTAPRALRGMRMARVTGGPPLQSLGHRVRAGLRDLEAGALAIACIEDVVTVAGAPGGLDALLTALQAGVRLVTATDVHDVNALGGIAALRPWMSNVNVAEPSAPAALAMVRAQSESIGRHHGMTVADDAIQAAVHLSVHYQPDRRLPGRALDLLSDACAAASLRGRAVAGADDVAGCVGEVLVPGSPVAARSGGMDLSDRLRERVVGQDRAVSAVADAIRRAATGVRDPDRPLGSLLFLGPTGVGKTELARTLAATVFGGVDALVRLDMGEYQEAHSVARLVGAPPGYVGYEHGGHLTEPLRRRPASVLLLDEIEKAHPDVLNTLLAVLDEGRLTDGYGRTVDARQAVLIMTSNLAGRIISDPSLTGGAIDEHVRDAVAEHFPPEFLGRVDEVVVFNRLSPADLEAIVGLQISRLSRRLEQRDLHVVVGADVRTWLAAQVIDSPHGARPLRASIRRSVEDLVARAVADGRLVSGGRLTLALRDDAVVVAGDHPW